MAVVDDVMRNRWRSGRHIGAAKPHMVVEICRGGFQRNHWPWDGDPVNADIVGETRQRPWHPRWNQKTDWQEIPGVLEVDLNQDFQQNGTTVATINIENIGYVEKEGLGGIYHAVEHGYLSPFRGYNPSNRPKKGPKSNEWRGDLARMARIRVWQGYGLPERDEDGAMPQDGGSNGAWTFAGLVDEIDPESHPDRITVTCRDFGKLLTDQRIFAWNKSRTITEPVKFMDRLEADRVKAVGGGGEASTHRGEHPARFVVDDSTKTSWQSETKITSNTTEWVQVRLPAGRYEEFIIDALYDGMELFVGFYAKARLVKEGTVTGGGSNIAVGTNVRPPRMDDAAIDEGWIGDEDVPGVENGGWPYLRYVRRLGPKQHVVKLNHSIVCGDDSILRVGFRRLHRVGPERYRAGVTTLKARRRERKLDPKKNGRVILVDDVADVVRVCLRWAGFDEWAIESTGVRLKGQAVFNRSSFLIDPILKACEQTGYVFQVGDPSMSESKGVPTFRKNQAIVEPPAELEEIRDTDLLTGIKVKISEEPLAWNIRVRGKETQDKQYAPRVGADRTRRISAIYRPPWSRAGRMSGVVKHVTHTYPELKTYEEVLFAAYLIALNEALQAVTAVVQIPGYPGFNLDDQVGILDTGTGMNTRMWIANRASTFTAGERTSWVMTLGGSMIDTPDMTQLINEMEDRDDDSRWVLAPAGVRARQRELEREAA